MIDVMNIDGRIVTINTDNPSDAVVVAYINNLPKLSERKAFEFVAVPATKAFRSKGGEDVLICGDWYTYADGRRMQ